MNRRRIAAVGGSKQDHKNKSRPKAAEYGCMSFMLAQFFTGELPQEVGRLCESTLTKTLAEHLQDRIAPYAAVDAANDALERAVLLAASIGRLDRLEAAPELGIVHADRRHSAIVQAARDHTLPTTDIREGLTLLDKLDIKREGALAKARTELVELERALPPSLVAVARILANVRRFCEAKPHRRFPSESARLPSGSVGKKFINAATEAFCGPRHHLRMRESPSARQSTRAFSTRLFVAGRKFNRRSRRAAGSENVDLTLANFYGQSNVNARAVLSESYRNAVAASIFLAAATRYNGAPRFIIHDVTSSFDARHQFSLMEAIRTKLQQPANADGLQFIILSHDTALEKYFDRQSGTTDWHHQNCKECRRSAA